MMHCFDKDIARKYGTNSAILLENIRYWIEYNKANRQNFHDGYYWTYNSVKSYSELFPYMSSRQISTSLAKLVKDGIIITGNYNDIPYDRTTWYAITEKGYNLIENGETEDNITPNQNESDNEKAENASCKNVKCIVENCEFDNVEMSNQICEKVTPIPNNKPDNKPNIKAEEERAAASFSLSESEYSKIIEAYNKAFDKKITLTPKRRHAVDLAYVFLSQMNVTMSGFFKRVASAKFLKGKEWATFDWVMDPEHIARIVEGSYDLITDPNKGNARIKAVESYDLEKFEFDALKPFAYSKKKKNVS